MNALQLVFALLLVLANGFFVGAEFALVSVRRSQIEPLAAGSKRARQVLHGLENLPRMMAAAQFGITMCSLTLGAVAEPTVARLLEPVFHAAHVPEGLIHPRLRRRARRRGLPAPGHRRDGPQEPRHGRPREDRPVVQPRPGGLRPGLRPGHDRPRCLRHARPAALQGRAEGRGRGRLHQRPARSPPQGLPAGRVPGAGAARTAGGRPRTGQPPRHRRAAGPRPARVGQPGGHPAPDRTADGAHRLLPVPRPVRQRCLHGLPARQGRTGPGGPGTRRAPAGLAPDDHGVLHPPAGRRPHRHAPGRHPPGPGRGPGRPGAGPGRDGGRTGDAGRRGARSRAPHRPAARRAPVSEEAMAS